MIHYEDMTKEQVIRILKDTLEYAEEKDREIERLNKELQDTKEHLGEYLYEEEEENKRLIKELKIKTDFIEELLYLILNSTDNKLQKEVHKIGIKYDKNIQKLKGSE